MRGDLPVIVGHDERGIAILSDEVPGATEAASALADRLGVMYGQVDRAWRRATEAFDVIEIEID
jgi:hypothetical protein